MESVLQPSVISMIQRSLLVIALAQLVYGSPIESKSAAGYELSSRCRTRACQRNWRLRKDRITAIITLDGSKIACSYRDGQIQIIYSATGALYHTLAGHSVSIKTLIYAAGESRLISCRKDDNSQGEVRLWNSTTSQSFCTIKTPVQHLLLLSEGKKFATGSRESLDVRVWHVSDGSI